MTQTACPDCHRRLHHRPDCRQMSFPSGRRRDDPGPTPALRPCDPERPLPRHLESPLGEELREIFAAAAARQRPL